MPAHSKRDQIIEGGLDLVHQEGFASTGVAAIAAAAGAPKGSFYNHFESKEAFGVAVLDKYFDEVRDELNQVLLTSDGTPLQRILSYFEMLRAGSVSEGFARGCLIGNLSAEASPASPAIRSHLHELLDQWRDAIATAVSEAQQEDQARCDVPAVRLAALLIDAWQGALLRAKVYRNAESIDDFVHVLLPVLLGAPQPGQ
jgi:TetR/AcrR family transcriptional regulator, transcriptional repressor for nem operon